jgi:hypothetical protein
MVTDGTSLEKNTELATKKMELATKKCEPLEFAGKLVTIAVLKLE